MFKMNIKFRNVLFLMLLLVSTSLLFTACNKNDKNIIPPDAAGIMGFNLAPDQNNVGFSISGNIFTQSPLGFGNYTATYRAIYTGSKSVQSFNYGSSALIDSARADFKKDKYYSTFLFGRNGNYDQVIVQDGIDSLPYTTNKAYVRMVNGYTLSNFTPFIVYTLSDSSQISNQRLVYKAVSEFMEVPAGEIKVEARAGTETKANRTINFEANKVYTLLLLDNANLDSLANPEIRFIVNGFIQQ